ALLNLLIPEGPGFLRVAHPGSDRRRRDLLDFAKVVSPVREPGIDDVGLTDVLHSHGAVRLPGLLDGPFAVHAATHRRSTVRAVHRAAMYHEVFVFAAADVLNVALGHIAWLGLRGPRLERRVGAGSREQNGR